MQTQQIKVFIRNSKKYAKILTITPTISSGLIKQKAAEANNLRADEILLHFEGKLLPTDLTTDITLHDKAIIHLIDLNKVNQPRITLQVIRFGDSMRSISVETDSQIKVRDFIDGTIFENFGLKSNQAFLVHIGRQLKLNKSFSEQHVQDGSQVVCVSIEYLKSKGKEELKEAEPKEEEFAPTVDVKGLETPEEPRDIYPSADFTISVPEEVNATNNLNLIFDSKIKHVGSLRNYDLEPEEIIPEEEPLAFRQSEASSQVESSVAADKENQNSSSVADAKNSEEQVQSTDKERESPNNFNAPSTEGIQTVQPANRQLTQSQSQTGGVEPSLIDV